MLSNNYLNTNLLGIIFLLFSFNTVNAAEIDEVINAALNDCEHPAIDTLTDQLFVKITNFSPERLGVAIDAQINQDAWLLTMKTILQMVYTSARFKALDSIQHLPLAGNENQTLKRKINNVAKESNLGVINSIIFKVILQKVIGTPNHTPMNSHHKNALEKIKNKKDIDNDAIARALFRLGEYFELNDLNKNAEAILEKIYFHHVNNLKSNKTASLAIKNISAFYLTHFGKLSDDEQRFTTPFFVQIVPFHSFTFDNLPSRHKRQIEKMRSFRGAPTYRNDSPTLPPELMQHIFQMLIKL